MTIPRDRLRDKRPQFLRIFDPEYHHFRTIPKAGRADAIAVYVCIAHHASKRDDTAFPSYATICDQTGLARSTATKAVAALVTAGLVHVEKRFHKGERSSNLYTLLSVVVRETDNPDVVVQETGNLARVTGNLVQETDKVARETDNNQMYQPNPINKKKERETRAVRAQSLPPEIKMTLAPDEVRAILFAGRK